MMEKRFSVLVTTYNHEPYITECISGLLEQLGSDDEIRINDDGSSDQTFHLLQKFKDPRIFIRQTQRQGPGAALNALISEAQGEYLSFISGDDRATKNRLQSQLEFMEKAGPRTFAVSRPNLIDESGKILGEEMYPKFFEKHGSNRHEMFRELFFHGNFLCAPSWVGRREEIRELPPFEPLSLQMQDFDFWIKALALGFHISISEDRWIDYRIPRHKKNLSSDRNLSRILFELRIIYRHFFEFSDVDFLRECFQKDLDEKLTSQDFCKELAEAYLCLMHLDPLVQNIALEHIYRLYRQPVFQEHLKRNGISEQFFFAKGNEVDSHHLRAKDLFALLGRKVERKWNSYFG